MRYLSPVLLLGETLQWPIDKKFIQRERKRFLAELELSDDNSLELHGELFSKSDIINYFEDLQNESLAAYHLAIWQDPVLLAFLQDGRFGPGDRFNGSVTYTDRGFIDWISRYFYAAFIRFTTACFDQVDSIGMEAMLNNPLLMSAEDTERGWQFISNTLTANISLFDHYKGRGTKSSPPPMPINRIEHFMSSGYVQVIRQLPNSRFSTLKDQYAFSMQHPSISVFNRDLANRTLAVIWMETAATLVVSEDTKATIENKLAELNGLMGRHKKRQIGLWIFVIIVGIRALVSISNSDSDNRFPANTTVYYTDTAKVLGHKRRILDSAYLDSLIHAQNKNERH
jgi:hypothetical protein